MTPAELRAAADRVNADTSFQYDGWYDDLCLLFDAARRLADVIEHASLGLLATSKERGSEGIAETHRQVLHIARGEDT